MHRRTVREALASATPPERKVEERSSPALGPFEALIREWLTADLTAPRKQRHTAHRIWMRLVDEHGASVSESTVRARVAQNRFELTGHAAGVTVPQTHVPGEEAEVDFGELWAWIEGVYTRWWMFCMRLSYSGRAFHLVFSNQATEAFLEGHVAAFGHFGGVPAGRIRYDNLKAAVLKVLLGRERLENPRFVALRSHYGFDSVTPLPHWSEGLPSYLTAACSGINATAITDADLNPTLYCYDGSDKVTLAADPLGHPRQST